MAAMAREFLAAIRKFVKDTHFTQFLKSQQQLYDVTNSRLKALMESRVEPEVVRPILRHPVAGPRIVTGSRYRNRSARI
jgi:hypothetical protein